MRQRAQPSPPSAAATSRYGRSSSNRTILSTQSQQPPLSSGSGGTTDIAISTSTATTTSRRRYVRSRSGESLIGSGAGGYEDYDTSSRSRQWEVDNNHNTYHEPPIHDEVVVVTVEHDDDHHHHMIHIDDDIDTTPLAARYSTSSSNLAPAPLSAPYNAAGGTPSSLSPDNYHHYPPPYNSPHLSIQRPQQQYQNVGGSWIMTEEKLRKFNSMTQQQPRTMHQATSTTPYHRMSSSSPSSSVMLTAWRLEQDYYRLEDFHTVFRVPHHVPDARYRSYLLGKMGTNNNNNGNDKSSSSMISQRCCAQVCVLYSGIGVVFLLFVGILLDTQPLYIPGTLPELVVQSTVYYKTSGGASSSSSSASVPYTQPRIQFLVPGPNDGRLPIATNAYRAALAYLCTMILSLYTLYPAQFHRILLHMIPRRFRRNHWYEDIPDIGGNKNSIQPDQNGGGGSSLLPTHFKSTTDNDILILGDGATTTNGGGLRRRYYHPPNLWNQTTNSVKRWLALRGWYRPKNYRKYGEMKKG